MSGFIGCTNIKCPVAGSAGDLFVVASTQKEATVAWNSRPIEDELNAKITKLKYALEKIRDYETNPLISHEWFYDKTFANIKKIAQDGLK